MAKALLALDQGTSSTRAFMYDLHGHLLGKQQIPLKILTPRPGWVEQNPEDIIRDSIQVLRNLIQQTAHEHQALALGMTNQRETTIVWDKHTGQAIYPAIGWQDRRTDEACRRLKEQGMEADIQKRTGLLLDPYFSALKIAWILDHVAGARQQAERGSLLFGTIDTFLLWHLSEGSRHATDVTNASRTMLFNIQTLKWDETLCEIFNIPMQMLAQVGSCHEHFATAPSSLLGATLPITGMIGDQQSASLAQGCLEPGSIKSTYGTGCFIMMNTGSTIEYSSHRLLTTVGLGLDQQCQYALEGSLFTAGSMMSWLRDKLGIIEDVSQSGAMAQSIPHEHDVMIIPALCGLGAPTWDASAKAAIFGLGLDTDKRYVVAAALEAICFQTKLLINTLEQDTHQKITQCYVDGGMCTNDWFLQTLSQTLHCDISKPCNLETTSIGAAFMAGFGLGLFQLEDIHAFKKIEKTYYPDPKHSIDEKYHQWLDALNFVSKGSDPFTHTFNKQGNHS